MRNGRFASIAVVPLSILGSDERAFLAPVYSGPAVNNRAKNPTAGFSNTGNIPEITDLGLLVVKSARASASSDDGSFSTLMPPAAVPSDVQALA